MSVTINSKTRRIGLALSGGGFRAAGFHLGVFRALHSVNLLDKIDLLTCVSGGSIAGAYLAAGWQDKERALDELDHFLTHQSLAVSAVLRGFLNPLSSRLDKLRDSYDKHLFKKATLSTLSDGPRVYFNATNLATGNMFSFVAGEGGKTELGDYEMGFRAADDIPIAQAVAASSAFPPVFAPMQLDNNEYPIDDVDFVSLTDGGVYDNLGANPLFRDRNALDYVIVSDAGKPFELRDSSVDTGSAVLVESIGILMEQVRGLQFRRLKSSDKTAIWFSIDGVPELPEGDPGISAHAASAAFASSIGTNLKKLSRAELDVLIEHGGALVINRLKTYTDLLS